MEKIGVFIVFLLSKSSNLVWSFDKSCICFRRRPSSWTLNVAGRSEMFRWSMRICVYVCFRITFGISAHVMILAVLGEAALYAWS